jgi:tetratricopeptide (TPR) repeat protein
VGQGGGAAEAVPEDPGAVAAAKGIFEQGAASYDRGQYGQAYDQFTRAYELSPRGALLFSRAQALRRLGGRRQEAILLYQEYLDVGDSKRAAEATLYIEELKTPESTGDLELDTTIGRAAFDSAAKAYERGDFGYAYDEFTKAWDLTKRPALLFSRAQALRRLGGHREEAIALYGTYVALGDGHREAEANKYIQALSTPESTGDLDKDVEISKSIFEKGAKLYAVGDYSHAYDEFTRSYELTERPTLLFSRAQAMRRIGGRREEAISLFQQYLDSGDTKRAADATRVLDDLKTKGASK